MVVNAKESKSILKTKKKLEKQMKEEKKRITPKALKEVSSNIHHWIVRHRGERIDLKEKTFALFDANHSSVEPKSRFVNHLLSKLKKESTSSKKKITFQGKAIRD